MGASALGNMGALEVATNGSARFLGADKDLGSIEVGKLADLMSLEFESARQHQEHARHEVRHEGREALRCDVVDEIWPKAMPFGPYYWVNDDVLQMNTKSTSTFDAPPSGKRP